MNTTYGSGVSTAYPKEAATGLPAKFGYIVKYYGYRDYPNEQDAKLWSEVVFRELSAGRPVLYGGTSDKNGEANYFSHSFVIDGYDNRRDVCDVKLWLWWQGRWLFPYRQVAYEV